MPLRMSLQYKALYCLMVWVMQVVERLLVVHTRCGQGTHSRTTSDCAQLLTQACAWVHFLVRETSHCKFLLCACDARLLRACSTCPANFQGRRCSYAGKWLMASGGVQIYRNASPTFVVGQFSPAMLQPGREVLQQAHLKQMPTRFEVQSTILFHAIAFLFHFVDILQMPLVQY